MIEGVFSVLDVLTRQNIRAFHDILTGDNGDDIEALVKAKDLYRLCLNKEQVNAQSIPDLIDILRETGNTQTIIKTSCRLVDSNSTDL